MADRLDDLARSLATPVSRRRALRLAAAAAVTSIVAARTTPAPAHRTLDGCPTCPRGNDPPSFTQFCGHARGVGCLFVCCPATHTCCQTDTVVVCCREGFTCGPIVNDGPTCTCKNPCGGACCADGEKCVDMVAGRCCAVPCGKECCGEDEKCVDPKRGTCCKKDSERACIGRNQTICCDSTLQTCCAGSRVTQCCGYGETCDPNGGCKCRPGFPKQCVDDCCKRTDKCCIGPSGRGFCAPRGWTCCGDTVALEGIEECCAGRFPFHPRFERCCGVSGKCPRTAECCPDGCCPAGSSCCDHGCCAFDGTPIGRARPFIHTPDRKAQALRAARVAQGSRPPVP